MGRPFWIVATMCSTLLLQKFDKTGFQTQQLKAPTIVRKKVRDLQEELRNLSDGLAQKAQLARSEVWNVGASVVKTF